MKTLKQLTIIIGAAALLFTGCSTFDDTEINSRVDDLEGRVTELETLVSQLNNNIDALQTIVEAVQGQDRIVSVTPVTEGDGGFKVTFEKAGDITVTNGHEAVISASQDSDGIYYWTIDGEYLLVGGNKLPATAEYGAPQMRINGETKEFEFSTDNGVTWTPCGDVATSGIGTIKDVVKGEDSVDFTLYDDSVISIPMVQTFAIDIEVTERAIMPNGSISIDYTIVSGDEDTRLRVFADEGFTADVSGNWQSGSIHVRATSDIPSEASILVVAINGKGEMTGKILDFDEGQFSIAKNTAMVGNQGGDVTIEVNTNLLAEEYNVMVDPGASGWLTRKVDTKAVPVRTDVLTFTAAPYEGDQPRTGKIIIMAGVETLEFTVTQLAVFMPEGGESDFGTFSEYSSFFTSCVPEGTSTEDGWTVNKDCLVMGPETFGYWDAIGDGAVVLVNSNTSIQGVRLGKLTSPVITSGVGMLTIAHSTPATSSAQAIGYVISITVTNGTDSKTFTIDKSASDLTGNYRTVFTDSFDVNMTGEITVTLETTGKYENNLTIFYTGAPVIHTVSWSGYIDVSAQE